ncbi:hypothetical protein [Streptomyces sp. NRRL S-350]|uniref:hypothetical protein n=1 Tax=Streptomyces sp. NRRL S-350 TaxID=1463902 RepID=UPI00068D2F63|nr:hypothetical protein [Streptomyces sp. NRRL S-350]
MTRDLITVCLPPTGPAEVPAALAAAMAPFWYDAQPLPDGTVQGEWDWWHIFGGDDDNGFAVRPGYEDDPRLVRNPLWSDGSARKPQPASRCDGGPRGLLALDADRAPVAAQAGADWDGWAEFSARFEPALSQRAMAEAEPAGPDSGRRAFAAFHDQPVIRALTAWRASDPQAPKWTGVPDPVAHFTCERDRFIRQRASRVVPTNVLLTLDGEWLDGTHTAIEPGALVGHAYFDYADRYLDTLAEDALLIRLRFHS